MPVTYATVTGVPLVHKDMSDVCKRENVRYL